MCILSFVSILYYFQPRSQGLSYSHPREKRPWERGCTSGSSDGEIYGVRCKDVANMLRRHIFQLPPVRDTADCV